MQRRSQLEIESGGVTGSCPNLAIKTVCLSAKFLTRVTSPFHWRSVACAERDRKVRVGASKRALRELTRSRYRNSWRP